MSTLLLSLLLVVLVAIGLAMGRRVSEHFADAPVATAQPAVSPALANLMATPALVGQQTPLNVDKLARDTEITKHPQPSPACPPCKACPDMSQYVRLDEVPCWNCTLP